MGATSTASCAALGVSTSRPPRPTGRIADLERQVRALGGVPVGTDAGGEGPAWEGTLQHAREACLAALRVWNDPMARFRAGTFALLFVAAWHSLAIAVARRHELDDDILLGEVFAGTERRGLRANVQFWVDLRNCEAHCNLGALDLLVGPYAVARLLNLEGVLVDEFGPEYSLGGRLTVPLPLSGFRDPIFGKTMPAPIPLDVQAILARAETVAAELEGDETFMMRVAFVPVAASDAVAYFVKPGAVPAELAEAVEKYVLLPAREMGSRPNFSATYVIAEVVRRTGHKLSPQLHADAARYLGARPPKGEDDRTVDLRYTEYITSFKRYLYSQSWIDHLVAALAGDGFRTVTGKDPLATQLPPSFQTMPA